MFDLIWFRVFRREDLNVEVYDVQRTEMDDGCQVVAKAHMACGQVS
jgi:hypothetical protein